MPKTERSAPRSRAQEDRPLARSIGARIRHERTRAKLTQAALAGERYTKAYVSALENGLVKPSMAALSYLAARLDVPVTRLLADAETTWTRLEADIRLAAGDWQAAVDAYTALLEAEPGGRLRPELLRGLAEAYCRLDRGREAVQAAAEAAAIFAGQGRRADGAWAAYWEAFGLYQLEQAEEARRLLLRVIESITSGGVTDPDLHVRALIALAMVASRDDEPERALGYLEQARGLVEGQDDRRKATFLFSLALSYRELGDLEAALSTGTQSLAHFRAAASELETASIENELALVYLGLGNVERAREHATGARAVFERLENDRWLAHVSETEAQIELAAGSPDRAVERATTALQLARKTDNRKAAVSASVSLARARRAMGDLDAAAAILDEAATVARDQGRRAQLQMVLGELAQVAAEQGDLRRAFDLSQEALTAGRAGPPPATQAPAERPRGRAPSRSR